MSPGSVPPTDWIIYGVPPLLLSVAAVRQLGAGARRDAAVLALACLGWLAYVAVVADDAFGARRHFPPATGVELPTQTTFATPLVQHFDGRAVLQLQAPGVITWTLQGNERIMHLVYGFAPEAYEKGSTNGAGFTVRLREGEIIRPIFHRALAPRQQPADRGPQRARIVLPPVAANSQLELAVDAGGAGDAAWDWVYLADTGFDRSAHFLPAQFPFHRTVPDTASAPLATLFQQGGRTTFLQLHAPAQLEYPLDGRARQLAFAYGFLPDAYQHGNATDGARFLVELRARDGASLVLLDRLLQPASRQIDQGPQWANVVLPAHADGTRLNVKIEPGPAGNNSWDWTYISRLSLEER